MGTGYKGNTDNYHSITDNYATITNNYQITNGLFGQLGNSNTSNIRHITSIDPQQTAKDFYDKIALGGKQKGLYYKDGSLKGYQTKMCDGTIINYRLSSSSDGTPAVDIDIQSSNNHGDIKTQKIHFVKGDK